MIKLSRTRSHASQGRGGSSLRRSRGDEKGRDDLKKVSELLASESPRNADNPVDRIIPSAESRIVGRVQKRSWDGGANGGEGGEWKRKVGRREEELRAKGGGEVGVEGGRGEGKGERRR